MKKKKPTNTYYHLICIIDIYYILTVQLKMNMDCKTIRSCKHSTIYLVVHLSFIPRCDYAAQTFQVCRTEKGQRRDEMNIVNSMWILWAAVDTARPWLCSFITPWLRRWQSFRSMAMDWWSPGGDASLGWAAELLTHQTPAPALSLVQSQLSFNVFGHQGLALALRFKCRWLQSLRVGFPYGIWAS